MKKQRLSTLLMASAMSLTFSYASATTTEFNAMTLDNILIAAVMGDTCNQISAELIVPEVCTVTATSSEGESRTCDVELITRQTTKGCSDQRIIVRTLEVDLANTGLASDVEFLNVKYGSSVLQIERKM